MNPQTLTDMIEVHRRHIEMHQTREAYLEHELALARASSDYWRAKYIAKVGFEAWDDVMKEALTTNALYWFERAARSPMDECDE